MSGPEALLVTLGALYLIECITAVPGGHAAFRGTARASWRLVMAGMRAGASGSRIVFFPFLPWMHGLVLASEASSTLDVRTVRERVDGWRRATGALRVDSIGMFVLVFVLAPIFVRFFGWESSWPFLVLGVVVLALLIVGDYRAAHAELHPDGPRAPLSVLMTIGLSPASAMRAPDVLLRKLLVTHHPLVVASVLLPTADYEGVASAWMRERRRLESLAPDDAVLRSGDVIEAFIVATVEDVGRLAGPPAPRDPGAVSYCPSCLDEFVLADGQCSDCGVRLELYRVEESLA
jgi:hypothetical protein